MVAFVVIMNWLYFRCGRSILIPIIFHTHPDSKLIQTALLLGASIIILVRERTLFFSTEHLTPTRDSVGDLWHRH